MAFLLLPSSNLSARRRLDFLDRQSSRLNRTLETALTDSTKLSARGWCPSHTDESIGGINCGDGFASFGKIALSLTQNSRMNPLQVISMLNLLLLPSTNYSARRRLDFLDGQSSRLNRTLEAALTDSTKLSARRWCPPSHTDESIGGINCGDGFARFSEIALSLTQNNRMNPLQVKSMPNLLFRLLLSNK
jgi:hypothetical protein